MVKPQRSGVSSFEGAKYGYRLLNIARRRTFQNVTSDFEFSKRTCKGPSNVQKLCRTAWICKQELRGRDGKRSFYSPVPFPLVQQIHAEGCTDARRWIIHVLCLTFQAQWDTVLLPLLVTEELPFSWSSCSFLAKSKLPYRGTDGSFIVVNFFLKKQETKIPSGLVFQLAIICWKKKK